MTFKQRKLLTILCATAAVTATAATTPAWRPDSRDDLITLVKCETLVTDEIVRREKALPDSGKWSLLHQALWRLEAERSLLSAVVDVVIDRDALPQARAAALPEGTAALAERERRKAVRACAPLADAIQAAGAENGGDLEPLPRLSLLTLSRLASEAAED